MESMGKGVEMRKNYGFYWIGQLIDQPLILGGLVVFMLNRRVSRKMMFFFL